MTTLSTGFWTEQAANVPLDAMRGLDAIASASPGKIEAVLRQAQPELMYAVRRALLESYTRAGLGRQPRHGNQQHLGLRNAMAGARVSFANLRWLITLTGGSERLYKAAASLRYGWVTQQGGKGVAPLGHRARRALKKKAGAGALGRGVAVHAAKKPFYFLEADQLAELAEVQAAAVRRGLRAQGMRVA